MSEFVVRLTDDRYVIWSDTVDAPVSPVVDRHRISEMLSARMSADEVAAVLDRADRTGTSNEAADLADILRRNRAGVHEETLSVDELLRQYDGG